METNRRAYRGRRLGRGHASNSVLDTRSLGYRNQDGGQLQCFRFPVCAPVEFVVVVFCEDFDSVLSDLCGLLSHRGENIYWIYNGTCDCGGATAPDAQPPSARNARIHHSIAEHNSPKVSPDRVGRIQGYHTLSGYSISSSSRGNTRNVRRPG